MKKVLFGLMLLLNCASVTCLQADSGANPIYRNVYPSVEKTLWVKDIFLGDRHNQFEGDCVAHLSDGSAWKIHRDNRQMFASWDLGDVVRIKVRTDHYWFKREHKFSLYNQTKGESAKVMIVKHINYPYELKIVATDSYAKSTKVVAVPTSVYNFQTGKYETVTTYKSEPTQFRKILGLSDGSYWVIKDHFDLFSLGSSVYVGAQGSQTNFYDFIFIVGDQREAKWTYARPQR